jgi:hypothetical protein
MISTCYATTLLGITAAELRGSQHRICAHISLCVLALLLERIAERRAGDTWRNVPGGSLPP